MKFTHGILIGSICILLSSHAIAWCGSTTTSSCGGEDGESSYYTSTCQCAGDLNCGKRVDTNCISESECCQAFGNIGAR